MVPSELLEKKLNLINRNMLIVDFCIGPLAAIAFSLSLPLHFHCLYHYISLTLYCISIAISIVFPLQMYCYHCHTDYFVLCCDYYLK